MSENKIIKTTVVADTSSYRKGMQDAAKETEDFGRKAQGAADPARDLGAALASTAAESQVVTESLGSAAGQLNRVKASAAQTEQALRQLPMQFTDIFTSLSSGMPPMQVLMQQGGQLKDSFGGVGPAAQAMGGYIGGLVGPLSATVGALGALALAYYQGSEEGDRFSTGLILTGNVAGKTVGELSDLAKTVSIATRSTQAFSADALSQVVSTGAIAADNIGTVAEASVRMARATGMSVGETIKQFVELGKDPVKASEKLNETANYLTADLYRQIKALEEHGKASEAASLAQKVWADTLNQRTGEITKNLGYIETAWGGVIDAAKAGWDAILGVGRTQSKGERIAELEQKAAPGRGVFAGLSADERVELAGLKAVLANEQQIARAAADRAASTAATIKWDREGEQFLPKKLRMEQEIAKARNLAKEASVSDVELQRRISAIEERYADKEKKTRTPKVRTDDDRVLGDWQRRVSLLDAEAAGTEKLTATEQAYVSVLSDVTSGRVKMTAAARGRFAALASEALALEQTQIQEKEAAKAAEEHAKWINALWQAEVKETARLEESLKKEEERVAALGLTKEAVNQLAAAQLDEAAAAKEVYAENLKAASAFAGEFADAYKQAAEEAKKQADVLRQTAVMKLDAANKEAQIETQKGWEKIGDNVGRSVTDALVQGGDAGIKMLQRAFKATVFQALVQPVMQQGGQMVAQVMGGGSGGAGAGGGGGFGNLLSMGNSVAGMSSLSAYTGAAGYMQFGSMASSFGTALTAASTGADLGAAIAAYEAAGMGATASSLSAGASVAGSVGSGAASALGSVMSGLATAAPYLAVALLVAQQLGAFKGPTYHHGGAYMADTDGTLTKANSSNFTDFNLGWGAYTVDRSSGFDDAMLAMSQGVAKQIEASIKAYGGQTGNLTVGTRFASDNDDWSEGAIRIVNEAGERVYDFTKRYTSDSGKALQQFGEDSTRALLATLKATDLNDEFDALFAGVDPLKNSVAELNAVLERASAIQQQTAALRAAIDSNFLEPAEQLEAAFEQLGVAVPESADGYEQLVRAQDLNSAAGRQLAASLMGVYGQWKQVEDAAQAAADAIAGEKLQLEQQLLQAQGDAAELRARELAQLDPSNRAIQERVWALEDEASAASTAADASRAMSDAARAMSDMWSGIYSDAADGIAESASAMLATLDKAAQRERTRLTAARDVASEAVTSVRSVLDLLSGSMASLYGSVDATAVMQSADAMSLISGAAAGGYMPSKDELSAAISAAQAGMSGKVYASQVDADRDRLVLAGQLSKIQAAGAAQLPVAERALRAATDQLSALDKSVELYRDQLNELRGIRDVSVDIGGTIEEVGARLVEELRAQTASFAQSVIGAVQAGRLGTGVAATQLAKSGVETDQFSQVGGQSVYLSSRGALYTSSDNTIRTNNGWAGSVEDARTIVAQTFATTSPADFYAAAVKVGLSGAMIEEMYQMPKGTAAEWAKANNLPAFAVGTDYVPNDMLALVHQGERITPAPYSGQQERLLEALVAEVKSLRATLAAVAAETRRTANAVNGNPDAPMLVETV